MISFNEDWLLENGKKSFQRIYEENFTLFVIHCSFPFFFIAQFYWSYSDIEEAVTEQKLVKSGDKTWERPDTMW